MDYPPECCQECGTPFNNGEYPHGGLCLQCGAGAEPDELRTPPRDPRDQWDTWAEWRGER